ncbi:M24 family metallopeptidase [Desulfosediminicola flagellatus]|uniref:M24 family metallopeptidase n=1 Tax=Desulfosediminicola flagellatus TaxID=2569541 RepID=UPI0010ACE18A|nr:Xaa-Pro peptidase family protein [Desulfosediminicola flagellatus]
MDYSKRIAKLQKRLRKKQLDGLLVTEPHNRRYLSGYSAVDHNIGESSGVLLIPARGEGLLLTDFRFKLQAEREVQHLKVKLYKRGLTALLKKLLPSLEMKKLGFESDYMLHSTHETMQKAFAKPGITLVPVAGLIEKMRLIKDEEEIDLIRKSVALNEEVFLEIYPIINAKKTEIDIALAIESAMRKKGAEGASFDSIVASGDNSALPHAVPSSAFIQKNRPITIDMGLVLNGYCSDMTRTFVPGKADKKYKKIHRIVRKAQLAGIKAVRAGVCGIDVDKAARDVIAEAGYGEYFGHSLGHGVGLAVHEAPRVAPRARQKLQAGMIVTVEPGIYIPGWGGIRLENMVVVRKDGCEDLNVDTTWLDL